MLSCIEACKLQRCRWWKIDLALSTTHYHLLRYRPSVEQLAAVPQSVVDSLVQHYVCMISMYSAEDVLSSATLFQQWSYMQTSPDLMNEHVTGNADQPAYSSAIHPAKPEAVSNACLLCAAV